MALWDNITRKASAVTEKAVQQAKNLTELAKLHGQIAELEKTVTDSYTAIGKQYVAAHPTDYEEAFGEWIGKIGESERSIQFLRRQIQELKGVSVCSSCGAEVGKDAAFCGNCGAPMPKDEPMEAEVVSEAVMQETCTEEVPAPEDASAPEAVPAPASEEI